MQPIEKRRALSSRWPDPILDPKAVSLEEAYAQTLNWPTMAL